MGGGRGSDDLLRALVLVGYKFVAYTPHCVNDQIAVGQFVSQVGDVYVNSAGLAVEVESPGQVQELIPAEDDAFVLSQGQEEVELLGPQFNQSVVYRDFAPLRIYRRLTDLDDLL